MGNLAYKMGFLAAMELLRRHHGAPLPKELERDFASIDKEAPCARDFSAGYCNATASFERYLGCSWLAEDLEEWFSALDCWQDKFSISDVTFLVALYLPFADGDAKPTQSKSIIEPNF